MPLKNFPPPSEVPTRRKDAGIWNHTDGYTYEYCPEHPRRNKRGGVLQHRLVMEEHLGRFLAPKEVVHHVNGDRKDNRIANLKLLSCNQEHLRFHYQNAPIHCPTLRSKIVAYASNPSMTIKQAQKDLGVSATTIHKICKKFGIPWKFEVKEYPPSAFVERILREHSRKEATAILKISLDALWRKYPEVMRRIANPNRLKTHGQLDEPETSR
jgi:hypothetical protein